MSRAPAGLTRSHSRHVSFGKALFIKVALFIPNLGGGGAERVMVHLANGLASRGMTVDLVLGEATGPHLSSVGADIRVVGLGKHRASAALVPLARYLRRERPNVLISALEHANVVAILARDVSRVPVHVIPLVQSIFSYTNVDRVGVRGRVLSGAVRWLYPRSDAIVADSKGSARDIVGAAGVPGRLVRVIYNPVIGPQTMALAGRRVEHAFFAEGAPRVIVAAGSFITTKDFPTLIRAFAAVRERLACRLLILGDGPDRGELESLARDLGVAQDLSLPGFVDNPFAYMARCAVFVVSSRRESMSLVLVEALAVGLPVVATNCDYGPREILQNGKYGRLVPVGDVQAMAEAIRMALTEPPPPISSEVLRPFTFDSAIDKYVDLIAELVHHR